MSKRALDLLIAGIGSVLTAPVIALLAITIRLESAGHPIYRQARVGRDGRQFSIFKLRTMVRRVLRRRERIRVGGHHDRVLRERGHDVVALAHAGEQYGYAARGPCHPPPSPLYNPCPVTTRRTVRARILTSRDND